MYYDEHLPKLFSYMRTLISLRKGGKITKITPRYRDIFPSPIPLSCHRWGAPDRRNAAAASETSTTTTSPYYGASPHISAAFQKSPVSLPLPTPKGGDLPSTNHRSSVGTYVGGQQLLFFSQAFTYIAERRPTHTLTTGKRRGGGGFLFLPLVPPWRKNCLSPSSLPFATPHQSLSLSPFLRQRRRRRRALKASGPPPPPLFYVFLGLSVQRRYAV